MRGPFVTTRSKAHAAAAKSRKRCRPRTPLSLELRVIMAKYRGFDNETALHVQGSRISNMGRTSTR